MNVRTEDHQADGAPLIKVTRDIPLPWIIGSAIVFAGQAVALYYGQQDLGKTQTAMAADVKQIKEELNRTGIKGLEMAYQVGDLNRRVTLIEAQQSKK